MSAKLNPSPEGCCRKDRLESFEEGHNRFVVVHRFRFPPYVLGTESLYTRMRDGLRNKPLTFSLDDVDLNASIRNKAFDTPESAQPPLHLCLRKLEVFLNTLAIAGSYAATHNPSEVFAPYGPLLDHYVRARSLIDDLQRRRCGEGLILERVMKAVGDIQGAWWSRMQQNDAEKNFSLGQAIDATKEYAEKCWQAAETLPSTFLERWEIERKLREERLIGSEAGLREASTEEDLAETQGLEANSHEFVCNGRPDNAGTTLFVPGSVLSSRASRMFGADRFIFAKISRKAPSSFSFLGRRWRSLLWTVDHVVYFAEDGDGLRRILAEEAMHALVPIDLNKGMTHLKLNHRLQLSFSKTRCISNVQFTEEEDFRDASGLYCLSDGCGSISVSLARHIADELGLSHVPSAFQARGSCFKGLWLVDPALQIGLSVRPSQKKYNVGFVDDCIDFEVMRYSQCDCQATLHADFIQALEHLGVPSTVFQEIQGEALQFLVQTLSNESDLNVFLSRPHWKSPLDKFLGLYLDSGITWNEPNFVNLRHRCLVYHRKQIIECLRLPLHDCTRVWMVPDITRTLQPGECFLMLSTLDSEHLLGLNVLSLRSPCYHPVSVRKLRVISNIPDVFRNYFDVLVLSAHADHSGPSDAEQMGGDFDGDQVLVLWDPRLVEVVEPTKVEAPVVEYPDLSTIEHEADATLPENVLQLREAVMREHKAFKQADCLRRAWADKDGFQSKEVLMLTELCEFGVDCVVNGNRIEIPSEIKDKPQPRPHWSCKGANFDYRSEKACGILYDQCLVLPDRPEVELLTCEQLQLQRWSRSQMLAAQTLVLDWVSELQLGFEGVRVRPISRRLKDDTEKAILASFGKKELPIEVPKSLLGTAAYLRCIEVWAANDRSVYCGIARKALQIYKAAGWVSRSSALSEPPSICVDDVKVTSSGKGKSQTEEDAAGAADQFQSDHDCELQTDDHGEYTAPRLLWRLFESNICQTVAEFTHGVCPQLVGDQFLLDPCDEIYFTQNDISHKFRTGECLATCLRKMLNGELLKRDFPMIRVRWYHGKFFALDNRRLALFRLFRFNAPRDRCSQVRVLRISDEEARKRRWHQKFSTNTLGSSILVQPNAQVIGQTADESSFHV